MMQRLSACGLLIFILVASGGHLRAQQAAPTADEPAGRRIYVPFEDLDAAVDLDKQGVILPRAEFLKLAADARKQLDLPQSPRSIVVSRAQYASRIHDDQLVINATIELNQLARGWQTVTLPYRGLALEAATLDDKPATIGRGAAEERPLVVFSQQPGQHTLKLQFSTPLVTVGSDKVAAFGVAPISAAAFQLTLPAEKNLHVDEVPLERPAAADQPADYTVAVGGKNSVSLRITDRKAREESASLVFAGTAIGLHVAPEERTWRAVTSLNVFGKPIDNLTFVIPRSLDIVSVESTGLERWEIAAGEGNTTTLKLVYRQPFSEARAVTFSGVSASVLGQPWSVPTLLLKSATSHLVRVLVQYPAGLRLQQVEATGIRRVPADEAVPDMPGSPEMAVKVGAGQRLHYAAWREGFSLLFVTQPRARELQATIATRIDIDSRELVLHSSIAVQTRFAPLFDFDLSLPVDWIVSDVLVENRPVRWRAIPVAAGLNQVRVTFNPPIPADGKVSLTLAARFIPGENWPIEETPLSFKLPEVSLPQVGVTDGRYLIAADDDLDLAPEDVRGLDPARLSAEEQKTAGAVRLAYEYQDTRFGGTLKVSRKPLRVAAQTLAYHRLDRESLVSHLEARLVIQGGGLQKLQIALPETAGMNLRFSLVDPPAAATGGAPSRQPQITEQTSSPPADGERVWTLSLDQRAFGLLWLVVDLTEKRSGDAASVDLPGLRVLAADRQIGFVAIEAAADQQLEVTATDAAGGPLVEIDPADVPVPMGYVPQERIVAAHRAVRPGFRMSVKETRYDREPVPTAICDKAILTSVLGESGQQQHKADFLLRAVGVQSLRVELPPEGAPNLWATLIDGRPIEVRVIGAAADGSPAWIVPLPPSSDPGQPQHVQLFYRTSGPSLESSGTLFEKPPRIQAVNGQGDEQPIEILDREWTLYHPFQTEISASTGQFEPVEKPERESFLGRLHARLSSVSPTELGEKGLIAALTAAAIAVFFFAWRRRGVAGVAVTMLVGVIVAISLLLVARPRYTGFEYFPVAAKAPAGRAEGLQNDELFIEERYERVPAASAPVAGKPAIRKGGVGGFGGETGVPLATPAPAAPPFAADQPGNRPQDELRGVDRQPAAPYSQPIIAGSGTEFESLDGRRASGLTNTFGQPMLPFGSERGRDVAMQDGSVPAIQGRFDDAGESAGDIIAGPIARPVLKGALLSLAIDVPVVPESRKTFFRYTGAPAADSNPVLDVEFQNRRALSFVSLAWQAGMLLIFWFARRWPSAARAMLGVLGILLPLALVSLVPVDVLPHLDGVFLGSLWGVALWALIAIVNSPRRIAQALHADLVRRSPVLLIALTIACGFANSSALAQDAKPPSPAGAKSDEERRMKAPTIVVPYELTEDPLQAARVFLPWDKFLELWNAAHPEEAAQRPAPTDGLVAEALYSAEIAAAAPGKKPTAEIVGRFVLYSFRDEQISLALPVGRVALTQAQLDGKSAALVTRESPAGSELTIVVPTRGVHVLDVKFNVPVEQTGAAGKLALPLQPVAAGTLRFTLPAGDMNLRVGGAAGAFRKVREGEKTIAIVPVDRGGDVTLAWTPAQVREAMQAIVHVESTSAIHLGDAGLRASSRFKYTVRQGAISEVSFSLPAGLLVRQIAGLDLGGWETAGDGADRTLKVFLRRPVNDATTLQFDLFMASQFTDQPQSLTVPQLIPQNVTRETGTLGVFGERQLTVTAAGASGLAQIDIGQFDAPGPLSAPGAPAAAISPVQPLFAYRFPARPVQLALLVARQKPQSKAVAEHAVVIGARKLRMASRLELHLAGAPRSEIAVQLPRGYLLYDLKASESVDYHVDTQPGEPGAEQNPLLIVEFSGPRTGNLELVLDGINSRAPEDMAPSIAVPAPLEIGELRSSLAVWLDRIYTAALDDHSGWKSVDPGELTARLRAAQNTPVQFAFTSTLTGLQPVALTLTRAVPRLGADGLAVVIARDTSVQYLLYLRWNIAAAGESTFIFTTPDWLADRLEFDAGASGVRLRQVRSEKIAGNRLRWTVTLDDQRTSVATLLAQATLPPPELRRVVAPNVTFEQELAAANGRQFQPLEVQHQFLVLVNQSPQRLEPEAQGAVEALPADDLPIKISRTISDQAAEILRVRDPRATVSWRMQGAQQVKSLPASVNLAKMTLVIARDGSWRGEADYRIHNRSRQFLALKMPAGSRVLSLFVADRPSRPIDPKRAAEPDVVLVPLPKTAAGDLAADVKLVFAGRFDRPLPKGVQVFRSDLDLPAPQVVSQGEFGIPVAATEWTVILPPDIDARRIDDSNRTNVTESEAGIEDLIARQNEWLNLYTVVVDDSESMAAKSRAMDNMKQLGMARQHDHDAERLLNETATENRQVIQWRELESKRQQAERQLQQQMASQKGAGGRAGKEVLSNKDVQRELMTSNSVDFAIDQPLDEAESLPQINLALPAAQPAAAAPAKADEGKVAGKSRGSNRSELRQQTKSQSEQLNSALGDQVAGEKAKDLAGHAPAAGEDKKSAVQDLDADAVLELSNAGAADFKKRDLGRKSPQEAAQAYQQRPRSGAIAGLTAGGQPAPGGMGAPAGGGGMGGGAGTVGRRDSADGAPIIDTPGWSSVGGLSLKIDVPQEGQKLTFSKSGGDARLALGLRPRESLEAGFGLTWTALWLLVAVGLIAALSHADASRALARRLPPIAAGLGLAWYLLLPAAPIGLALFVLGSVCLGWQHRRGQVRES